MLSTAVAEWRTFLTNHVPAMGSMDFFTVPTVTARGLFVFVVLLHHRRRIVHFNVTTCARPKVPLERSRMAAIPNSRADHARVVATTTGNQHPRRFWRRTGQCRCQLSRGVGRSRARGNQRGLNEVSGRSGCSRSRRSKVERRATRPAGSTARLCSASRARLRCGR
jgi:hypothetical protein